MYSDRYTPVEVMRILRKESRHYYLLESAGQTEQWGRYSFLGYDPSMEITCTDGKMRIRKTSLGGWSEEEYEEMIEKAKHYIREGDIFQVVLSNPMRAKAEGSLFDTYRALRTHNPSPYMFYFFSDDIKIAHAVAYAKKIVPQMDKDEIVVITLSGRGDKDCAAIARYREEDIHE